MPAPLSSRPPFVASSGVAINVSSANYVGNFSALWVGTAGAIALIGLDGNPVTYPSVPNGWFSHAGTTVLTAGTTATGLVAAN